jgi:hypothetical protein
MKFNAKEIILFAAIFGLGFAIYMMGNVLNDFDIEIAQLKTDIRQCIMSDEN